MFTLWLCVIAFLITLAEAMVSAAYTGAVAAKRALKAASLEALFQAILVADILLIYDRWWLVFPICAGGFLGVYYIVRRA